MEKEYYELYNPGRGEITVKKSRFIGECFCVKTPDEAADYINEVKKKYYDARHHCYAYCLGDENSIRSSDDGEPSGTAGRPILDVILGAGLLNTMVIVTRYFGGTLLGTGGLTRAYKDAAKEAINASEIIQRKSGICAKATLGYDLSGKAENIIKESGAIFLEPEYTDKVTFEFLAEEAIIEKVIKYLTEISSGEISVEKSESKNYGVMSSGVVWL